MKKILLLLAGVLFVTFGFSQNEVSGPIVIKANYFDVSPPLHDLIRNAPEKADNSWKDGVVKNHLTRGNWKTTAYDPYETDPLRQGYWPTAVADTTIQNFSGISGDGSYCPPDTDGDVGPNHYFQVVNCKYQIFNKTGQSLQGPANNSSIFSGLPNNSNDGDAVVLYDEVADRWLFSQFSLPNYPNGPFYEMVAISQTPDPTGSWYRYQFTFTDMPDYPKIGVWPDGYYMTVNRFASGSGNYKGVGIVAMDRTKMLAGDPTAAMVMFTLPASNPAWRVLPSDCDGEFPPMGTPNYCVYQNDGPDQLDVSEFHVDFTTTANSTYTHVTNIAVSPFNPSVSGVPQKGTSVKVDAFAGTLMFRLPFMKYSDHWSIAACATVNVGSGVAGIRWYEIRKTGSNPWSLYQEGTWSPDNNYRWMCSIALDTANDIAIGYNISSANMYPSIRYTGRLANDPLGTLTMGEHGIVNGGGSQTNTWSGSPSRWGDYAALSLDPAAAETFWYTTEYYTSMSQANWKTRIASFSFFNVFNIVATATPEIICTGQSSQLECSAVGGSGNYTYSWTSVPAGFTSSIPNPVVTPSVDTKYICHVSEGTQSLNDTVLVTVATEPVANAGHDTTYCIEWPLWPVQGQATSYSTVHWTTLGDGTFNNDTTLYVLYTPGVGDKNTGGVTLRLTANPLGSCTTPAVDDIHIILTPCNGVEDMNNNVFGLNLSPNPTTGQSTVTITGVKDKEVNISVANLQGTTIYEGTVASAKSTLTHDLDLSSYSKGVYIVKVIAGGKSATGKLVVK